MRPSVCLIAGLLLLDHYCYLGIDARLSSQHATQAKNYTRIVQFPIGDAYAIVDKRTGRNSYGGIFWEMVELEKWEPQTFLVFNTVITHITTVIDFGAWIGPTALYAAHYAKEVYALEPDVVAYQEAHRNINLNAERLRNIRLYHRCISSRREAVTMNRGPNAPGDSMSTVHRSSATIGTSGAIPVQCDTIIELAQEFSMQAPLFVKVDTEGFEAEILPTWGAFVEHYKPTVYCSMHQQLRKYSDKDKLDVTAFLRLFPYVVEVKDCIRCDKTFVPHNVTAAGFSLCERCDYLLSFKSFF